MSGRTDESGVFEPDGPEESASAMQQFDQEYAMPEPRGPEGAKCKCGHSMDQHTDSMAAAPCAFWGCRCDDFDQDPAPSPPGPEGQQADRCDVCGVSVAECRGHRWVDPAPSSPSPAGPGEAETTTGSTTWRESTFTPDTAEELCSDVEAMLAGHVETVNWGIANAIVIAIRDILARLREAEAANGLLQVERVKLYEDNTALRALLARLREAEETYPDEHGTVWSVPTAWAYMRACRALEEQHSGTDTLRAEVARLSAELREAEEKSRRYQFAPMGDNHHNAALCPYCSPQSEVARLTAHLATARAEEREAFTPKPTDQDKSGGWSISTAWIQSVQDGAKEDVSMEQVEAVLVSAAALRTRKPADREAAP